MVENFLKFLSRVLQGVKDALVDVGDLAGFVEDGQGSLCQLHCCR